MDTHIGELEEELSWPSRKAGRARIELWPTLAPEALYGLFG